MQMYDQLPEDPAILLSFINTLLRDTYASLDELCRSLAVDRQEITDRLSAIEYEYDEELNRFV